MIKLGLQRGDDSHPVPGQLSGKKEKSAKFLICYSSEGLLSSDFSRWKSTLSSDHFPEDEVSWTRRNFRPFKQLSSRESSCLVASPNTLSSLGTQNNLSDTQINTYSPPKKGSEQEVYEKKFHCNPIYWLRFSFQSCRYSEDNRFRLI